MTAVLDLVETQNNSATDEAWERETVIRWSDAEDTVYVSTSRRTDITSLLKIEGFVVVRDDHTKGNPRLLEGTLPSHGFITFRQKAKGSINRESNGRKGMPANAARCGAAKKDGTFCQALASKVTGRCARHPEQ